ncbi:MAG: GNAT family N-acetyltransferase [Acidobacteria bacterium]|nr:GNAT family N-acetyltransferase [Acidobacteriota bacterium]
MTIEPITTITNDQLDQLATLLHACVHTGASVSFVLPFEHEDAKQWWLTKVAPQITQGNRILIAATQNHQIAGAVQLLLDTPPNQPHRADVAKLLVHPDARRQGIARSLMLELEQQATNHNRTLLTLDTVTGSHAQALYEDLGYHQAGIIPGYALNSTSTSFEPTTILYKHLGS